MDMVMIHHIHSFLLSFYMDRKSYHFYVPVIKFNQNGVISNFNKVGIFTYILLS